MSPDSPPWRTGESLGELSHPSLGDDSMLGKERVQRTRAARTRALGGALGREAGVLLMDRRAGQPKSESVFQSLKVRDARPRSQWK